MRTVLTLVVAPVLILLSCNGHHDQRNLVSFSPKAEVHVAALTSGYVSDSAEFIGTVTYLKRNVITAPIPAYITNVNVHLGDVVKHGELLFVLESKERRALKGSALTQDTMADYGVVRITAPASGIISTLDRQQEGDYVSEGVLLCTVVQYADVVIQINVPYEQQAIVHSGAVCRVTLPDNRSLSAIATKRLATVNRIAQTEAVLATISQPMFIPDGLMVTVKVEKEKRFSTQIVPTTAVQTDAMMKTYWIMSMINDSTAVKIPVIIGMQNKQQTEILKPTINQSDRIISIGSYGLSDTAFVRVLR